MGHKEAGIKNLFEAKNFSLFQSRVARPLKRSSKRDFRIVLETPYVLDWSPGQFVMLRWGSHIIGRPFAIVKWSDRQGQGLMELWVRELGAATVELSQWADEGKKLWVTAPLGQGIEAGVLAKESSVLFISGGVGGASILPIWSQRRAPGFGSDIWIHGERSPEDFDRSLGCDVLCLEEGSLEKDVVKGRVTDALDRLSDFRATHVVVCGPTPMLKAVGELLQEFPQFRSKPIYMGLEEKMACGIGLCFSCSVLCESTMKRSCTEGPWFDYKKIAQHFEQRGEGPRVG